MDVIIKAVDMKIRVDKGETLIHECRFCQGQFLARTTAPIKNYKPDLWSDGRMNSWMQPPQKVVGKCPRCEKILWVEDCKIIENPGEIMQLAEVKDLSLSEIWTQILSYNDLLRDSAEEYRRVNIITPESRHSPRMKEKYLRFRFWHGTNDVFRNKSSQFLPDFADNHYKENLAGLEEMLNLSDPFENLLRAEIKRELGDFDGASLILPGCLCGEFKEFASQINVLNKKGQREIIQYQIP